jgi:hypothetical protein
MRKVCLLGVVCLVIWFAVAPLAAQTLAFTIVDRGGVSFITDGSGVRSSGYSRIQPASSTTPAGVAIFGLRQNNILVGETGVPVTPALASGRIYAEIAGAVDTGLAIANPNSSTATINFFFTDSAGNPAGSGITTIPANQQIAQFLDQAPFNVYPTGTFQGTFSFTSNVPVAVIALRGFTNERSDFLTSTLPVIDTTLPPNNGTVVVPHFADGQGWTTQIFLINPTDNPMTGTVLFTDKNGVATNVNIGGQTGSSFNYLVPKRTSQKLATAGANLVTASGSIRIVPGDGGASPTPLIVFSYRLAGITQSEAGVPVTSGTAFRLYVESSGKPGDLNNIQTGLAVANISSSVVSVTFDVTDLNGATVSGIVPVPITLPGSGQTSEFLGDLFPSLPSPFKGVLRITTMSSGISVVGLRTRSNERNDFLITTTPPTNENVTPRNTELFFPHLVNGGDVNGVYTTQFVVFSGTAGQATSGNLKFLKQDGTPLNLSGTGATVPTRTIGLSGNLAFGNVQVNATTTTTLTISNNGNSALTVSSIAYPPGFSGAWSGTVPAGGSQPLTVTFAPMAAASYAGTITVNANQTSGANTISVSGTTQLCRRG